MEEKNNSRICIFELKNNQNDYAICLQFMKVILSDKMSQEEKKTCLLELVDKCPIYIANIKKNVAPRYLEMPLDYKRFGTEQKQITDKKRMSKFDVQYLIESRSNLRYHVRIHIDKSSNRENVKSSFVHLQYLALFLRRLDEYDFFERVQKRDLTIFIVPETGEQYPFRNSKQEVDSDTYFLVSHYLKLLSKVYKGGIYGVIEENSDVIVKPLDFKLSQKYETYFPIILFDDCKYEKLFNTEVDKNVLRQLLKNREGRFGKANSKDHDEALTDCVLEIIKRRMMRIYADGDLEISQNEIEALSLYMSKKNSVIQLVLFSFMISRNDVEKFSQDETVMDKAWKLSEEVCQGIKQIVQNSIQHSQMHECVFSLYLHQSNENESRMEFSARMHKNYCGTPFVFPNEQGRYQALEIFASDLNETQNMIQKFVCTLNDEIEEVQKHDYIIEGLAGHELLLRKRQEITIADFFADHNRRDMKSVWRAFRQQDLAAHIGLNLFALTAYRCRASIKVCSTTNYELNEHKCYFYKAYGGNEADTTIENQIPRYVIPGTQFSILIPLQECRQDEKSGLAQLQYADSLIEDYSSYAKCIDYTEKKCDFDIKKFNDTQFGFKIEELISIYRDARAKYECVLKWQNMWRNNIRSFISQNVVGIINCDCNALRQFGTDNDEDKLEVCIKGLIGALSVVERTEKDIYIALTNLPNGFNNLFCKMCAIFGTKRFPSKLQLCLHEDEEQMLFFMGNTYYVAMKNAYVLSLENGFKECIKQEFDFGRELHEILTGNEEALSYPNTYHVVPFDVILLADDGSKDTLFEKRIASMVEKELDGEDMGYKLSNTHMRLGSKVHIEAFYEMSFLFYRTTIANRVAFTILRKLMENQKEFWTQGDAILFYGYASYSKAVLNSITEILKKYRVSKGENIIVDNVAFATYQHNLQLESEETQMYFGLSSTFPGKVLENNKLQLDSNCKKLNVIQIVPISSTLTTFDKMFRALPNFIDTKQKIDIVIMENHTMFWVVDARGDVEKGLPSVSIEKKYWTKVESVKKIVTKFKLLEDHGNKDIFYCLRAPVTWHNPLLCDQCYPDISIDEFPLIETDPTSTVPTQQIRAKRERKNQIVELQKDNNERLLKTKGLVAYGHICRGDNHYQYFLDTQNYFYRVKADVEEWLKNMKLPEKRTEPVLNIIFSPEHNTNVGFAQYVNVYYFNGQAEVISLNVDKEFRSNFVCEHASLIRTIKLLYASKRSFEEQPVKFYFVDDTIISGDTYTKANKLLYSLIPHNVNYMGNIFAKVFVLFDRLSVETKRMYVDNPQENFHAFLHVDISNTRTKGDSCVGCKLKQDAHRMFKRSATRASAQYWLSKYRLYKETSYDNIKDMSVLYNSSKAYSRFILSHVLQNILNKTNYISKTEEGFDILTVLMSKLLSDNLEGIGVQTNILELVQSYDDLLKAIKEEGVKNLLKIISRPFFTYDIKLRRPTLTLFILLCEEILQADVDKIVIQSKINLYLTKNQRIKRIKNIISEINKELVNGDDKLEFLQEYLFDGLTDLGSTYLMRKRTISNVYHFVRSLSLPKNDKEKEFWKHYALCIYRIVSSNKDETKELWLEHLCLYGEEYRTKNDIPRKAMFLYETITGKKQPDKEDVYFYQFCHELFLQNTGISFDGLEKSVSFEKDSSNLYFMEYWEEMRNMHSEVLGRGEKGQVLDVEKSIFQKLLGKDDENSLNGISARKNKVEEWYRDLFKKIAELICKKYGLKQSQINIEMLVESSEENTNSNRFQKIDIIPGVSYCVKKNSPELRYKIKRRLIDALEMNENDYFSLENMGYYISHNEKEYYVILFFDKNDAISDSVLYSETEGIERVFIYLSISVEETQACLNEREDIWFWVMRFILRDLLTYRNRFLHFLKRDFEGDIFTQYAKTVGEKNILSHEKATSHNTTADDEISVEIFVRPELKENYKMFYKNTTEDDVAKWLILRNYNNGQIAKIFNRSFSNPMQSVVDGMAAPPMYVEEKNYIEVKDLFKQKLIKFSDLGIEEHYKQDGRFKLLSQVIDINIQGLSDAEFIHSEEGQYYNLEYFRCVIIDVFLSAIKYQSDSEDYLTRIDNFLYGRKKSRELKSFLDKSDMNELKKFYDILIKRTCKVIMHREETTDLLIDYLVIKNYVWDTAHNIIDWEAENICIEHRLLDPLDYADGHMSLLAIKNYVENLIVKSKLKCMFCYEEDNFEGKNGLCFVTKLPVLKKEGINNEKVVLD